MKKLKNTSAAFKIRRHIFIRPLFFVFGFFFCLMCAGSIDAQISAPQMPAAPTIQPVAVPSVSAVTNQQPYSGSRATAQTAAQTENKSSSAAQAKKSAQKTLNTSSVSAASLSSLASSLFGGMNTNTQNTDILSSLLGNTGSPLLGGTAGSVLNPAANLLLEQILARLEEIQQQLFAQPARSDGAQTAGQTTSQMAKILRFTVNNYNVLETCRTLFFSKQTKDGNFLLTGDRKYLSDGKTRDETFYLLFKKNNLNTYEVACSVSQDYENQYSFLYQLSQKNLITASQTGNFITVRVNEPAWKMDLLIDASDLGLY